MPTTGDKVSLLFYVHIEMKVAINASNRRLGELTILCTQRSEGVINADNIRLGQLTILCTQRNEGRN